jgi:MFS family permease
LISDIELVRAMVAALRFDEPRPLPEVDWKRLLGIADRERLTLAYGLRCRAALPEWVAERIDRDLIRNELRHERIQARYGEIAQALTNAGIDFAVLKGFTHGDGYVERGVHRPQYDLDFLVERDRVLAARDVVAGLGYEAVGGFDGMPLDHLPVMIRRSNWRWQGDFYDVDLPLAVELHFQLWNVSTEKLPVAGLEDFWGRREGHALAPADRLAYACLHLLRHLFRGDVRLYHVYEIAHFLEHKADDAGFWLRWRELHSDSLRQLESTAFALATHWFGCRVPQALEAMPPAVMLWLEHFGWSPADAKVAPNKNELWLHLSLLSSNRDRASVALRRLLPMRQPTAVLDPHVPEPLVTWRLRTARIGFRMRYTLRRLMHHLRASGPTAAAGCSWLFAVKGLDPQFLVFLIAASLFNFGLSIYFLLYNLFLLQRGFAEDTLGAVSSAMSAGSIAGTIPAAYILRRLGIRTAIAMTFAGVAAICVIRAAILTPAALMGSAFAGGFLFACYAVTIAPAVAQWTTERARPRGFSLVFSLGIGIGILANLAGGHLPSWTGSLQTVLFLAAGIAALGALPAMFLAAPPLRDARTARVYPRGRFVHTYVFAILLWSLATGLVNPFMSAYLSKVAGLATRQIGELFSFGQVAQVTAILVAPLVLKRFGAVPGIIGMQLATACAAALFALSPTGWLVVLPFALFKAFEYMSEPGLHSLLMSEVAEAERSGASAMNFFTMFLGHSVAAALGGMAVKRFGYGPVFCVAAALTVLSALAFRQISVRKSTTS